MNRGRRPLHRLLWALAIVVGLSLAWTLYRTSRAVERDVEVLNPRSTRGVALVVYHPGLSDFQERVTRAYAEGLVAAGWRVELTTASSRAPTDLARYDLVVLGSPTYFWAPARPVRQYLARLRDLGGKPTVVIITAAGQGQRAATILERLVREANGRPARAFTLYTMAPNDEQNYKASENKAVAVRQAREAGHQMPPPRG